MGGRGEGRGRGREAGRGQGRGGEGRRRGRALVLRRRVVGRGKGGMGEGSGWRVAIGGARKLTQPEAPLSPPLCPTARFPLTPQVCQRADSAPGHLCARLPHRATGGGWVGGIAAGGPREPGAGRGPGRGARGRSGGCLLCSLCFSCFVCAVYIMQGPPLNPPPLSNTYRTMPIMSVRIPPSPRPPFALPTDVGTLYSVA